MKHKLLDIKDYSKEEKYLVKKVTTKNNGCWSHVYTKENIWKKTKL